MSRTIIRASWSLKISVCFMRKRPLLEGYQTEQLGEGGRHHAYLLRCNASFSLRILLNTDIESILGLEKI